MNGFTGNISDFRTKTPGQLAYERDVILTPVYHNGNPRARWEELGDIAQWSWERTPITLDEERVSLQHEEILAGLSSERAHSRFRDANGNEIRWSYNGNGKMVEVTA